ncbi:hypothetical protein [Neolewinella lacunae]|nr:hypothetical protein [Neolewinella lacunae]
MPRLKKILLTLLLLTVLAAVFRGPLYRTLVDYESVGASTNYTVKDEKLADLIASKVNRRTDLGITEAIKLSLSITSSQLHFTADNNDVDPNKLVTSKATHCVGYAAFFAATCKYVLSQQKLASSWTAEPQEGQLYFLGTNLHQYFHSAFLKDHDFVAIENHVTGEVLAVDPTIKDYFHIDFIRLRP